MEVQDLKKRLNKETESLEREIDNVIFELYPLEEEEREEIRSAYEEQMRKWEILHCIGRGLTIHNFIIFFQCLFEY